MAAKPEHHRLAARAAIVLLAGLASVATVQSAAGGWLSTTHPAAAQALAPGDARAAMAAAVERSQGKAGALDPAMRAWIGTALDRDVTDPRGLELLALADDRAGRHAQAAELFRLSDAIGRRSLPTRLWLIQSRVDAGDVAGALRHFDIALRTAPEAGSLLFPILAQAAGQPALARPVAALLDRPSDWRLPLFHTPGAATGLTNAALAMHDRAWLRTNHIDDVLIAGLVAQGDYRQAARVSAIFHPGGDNGLLHDGSFGDPQQRYPFGWQLEQGAEIEATRARIGGHPVLRYAARLGGSGPAATQLLQLAPGRYRLWVRVAEAGADPIAQPFWTLTCADGGQIALLEQPQETSRPAGVGFTVAPGCEAQWLSLHLRSSDNAESEAGAISAVAVERADNAPKRAG